MVLTVLAHVLKSQRLLKTRAQEILNECLRSSARVEILVMIKDPNVVGVKFSRFESCTSYRVERLDYVSYRVLCNPNRIVPQQLAIQYYCSHNTSGDNCGRFSEHHFSVDTYEMIDSCNIELPVKISLG
jgi:hypothetical protein